MLHFYHFIVKKKTFLQFSKCSHPCLIFLNMSCLTVEIEQSNWMYVSRNSTQSFESNVFKMKFFVELKTVMLFVTFKVWITINGRVKWKIMWIWIFILVGNLKTGTNWFNQGYQDSIPKTRNVPAKKLGQLECFSLMDTAGKKKMHVERQLTAATDEWWL